MGDFSAVGTEKHFTAICRNLNICVSKCTLKIANSIYSIVVSRALLLDPLGLLHPAPYHLLPPHGNMSAMPLIILIIKKPIQ